jgi:DNA-directed RNA polymerase subunit RPC12/RpoP
MFMEALPMTETRFTYVCATCSKRLLTLVELYHHKTEAHRDNKVVELLKARFGAVAVPAGE